ncbi:MAG: nucleotidyltransferase family protein [Chitinophagaceae bacterium]
MATECIILSGGQGTRLRSVVADLPKSMATIAGKPFLWYLVQYFLRQGVATFIFALGYMHEAIEAYLSSEDSPFFHTNAQYKISVENEPLGTGGAIQKAAHLAETENVFIANGDTLFEIDADVLKKAHETTKALCTLALKPMKDFERYGVVELDESNQVVNFKEKQYYAEGNINGGVYMLNAHRFLQLGLPEKFSFEKDFLEQQADHNTLFGILQNGYFIDIGIPEDYGRAQAALPPLFGR